jgi:hypothetical protein
MSVEVFEVLMENNGRAHAVYESDFDAWFLGQLRVLVVVLWVLGTTG